MMRVLYVIRHYLKRMIRNRPVVAVAAAVPVVCGIGCVLAAGRGGSAAWGWVSSMLCAIVAWGWVMLLVEADSASGLTDALRGALSDGELLTARLASGAAVFGVQVVLLVGVLAVGR